MRTSFVFLFITIVTLVVSTPAPARETLAQQRERAITCVLRYVDKNHDGCLDQREVSTAVGKTACVGVMERFIVPRIEKIFLDCDADRNNCISATDMRRTNRTCLADDREMDLLLTKFCVRAAAGCNN